MMLGRLLVVALILLVTLVNPLASDAQPAVSSASQQTSSGVPVLVVSGSRFGSHGNHNPTGVGGHLSAAWQDFETGSIAGGNMYLDDRGAPYQWSIQSSGARPNSNFYVKKAWIDNRLGDLRTTMSGTNGKFFMSFYINASPATAGGGGKYWRTWGAVDNIYLSTGDINLLVRGFSECPSCSPAPTTVWGSPNPFTANQWHRIDIEMALNPDWFAVYLDSKLQWRRSSTLSGSEREQWIKSNFGADGAPIGVGSMVEGTNNFFKFDDIFLDYTYARVELGNAPTWSASTQREVQLPRQWSDTGITVQLNRGAFNNGQQVFLYVVDANGAVNANGLPLTLGSTVPDTTPPTVASVSPSTGATGVPVSSNVTAVFNEAMDPATIGTATVKLKTTAGTAVTAAVGYNPSTRVATLDPTAPLAGATSYTATVTSGGSGAKDMAGNPLASDYTWSFTTGVSDFTPPTITLTSPANGSSVEGTVNVAANAGDNVGVVGVQFKVDGADIGSEDGSAPYSVPWNTMTLSNGQHTVTAVARDAAGNQGVASGFTVVVSNPLSGSLVLAYGFEEGSGSTATDLSGQNNTGTILGATRTTAGRFGSALTFDGVDDWVTIPDAASLDLRTGLTLEAWVYPTELDGWRTVLLKESPGGLAYVLYGHDDAPKPAAYLRMEGSNSSAAISGVAPLPLNTWTHLAATFDGSMLRLYVGGVVVASQPASGTIIQSSTPLRLGGNNIWGEYFTGRIDEIRVYNRALTTAEVAADMNTPVRPVTTPPNPPTNLRIVR